MAGGKTTYNTGTRLNGVQIQSTAYGQAIPRGWGTFRIAATVLWMGGFQAIATTTKTRTGGKGGGGGAKTVTTTYSYKTALALGICAGPIEAIRTTYRDKAVTPGLGFNGLSLKTGEIGQSVWGHLAVAAPDQAINYSGIAYAYSAAYDLNDNATIGNHSFEVVMPGRVPGSDDADPALIVEEFLSEIPFWAPSYTGDLSSFSDYCLSAGLLLSPVLDSQSEARSFVEEILRAANSDCAWSDGKFKVVPLGDAPVAGNGRTWEPDLTPAYDLTEDDFLQEGEDDPIQVDINRPADAYNYVQIEYRDRARQYNEQVAPGIDQANIDEFGVRKADVDKLHCIADGTVAATVANLRVQQTCNVRRTFRFGLPENFSLLEPLNLVTLTSGKLDRVLVRINRFDENPDGSYDVEAEEMLVGTANAPEMTRQDPEGLISNFDAEPGDTNAPVLINPPRQLTNGALEVWIGASGGPEWGGCEVWSSLDGDTYQKVGQIDGPARYGVLSSALPLVADPDETSVVGVNLAVSGGTLFPATQTEADSLATLCLIGNEVVAYRDAELTGANAYDLAYFRRGLFNTSPAAHAPGATFVRLDEGVFELPYREDQVGQVLSLKFRSFNVYGRAYQDLADLDPTTFTLTPSTAPYTTVPWDTIEDRPPPLVDLVDGLIDGNLVTGVGGQTLYQSLEDILLDVDGLIATYGDTATASASASAAAAAASASEDARDAAQTAKGLSELARDIAEGYRDGAATYAEDADNAATEAGGYASASAASASLAQGHSDDAGDYATAANAQRVLAETARGQAQTAASNAATSESNAAGSASSASSSATVSASARDTLISVTRNGNFDQGKLGWEDYGLTTWLASRVGWSGVLETAPGVNSTIVGSPVTIKGGSPRYRIGLEWYCFPASPGPLRYYAGLFFYDASGSLVAATDGTGNYPIAANTDLPPGEQHTRSVVIGRGGSVPASLYGGTTTIPSAAISFRPILFYNYLAQAGAYAAINYFTVEDVTESEAALASANASASSASAANASQTAAGSSASAAQAAQTLAEAGAASAGTSSSNASSAATSAAGSAAAAATSASLSATVSVASLLGNSRFSDWSATTAAGTPLPWGIYDQNFTTNPVQVAGEVAGMKAMQLAGPAGANAYVGQISNVGTISPFAWYVVEADVRLDSGTLTGAGVYAPFLFSDSSGAGGPVYLVFKTSAANNTGVAPGDGVVGQTYRYSLLVQAPAGASRIGQYAMTHWNGFDSIAGANSLTWFKNSIRPATEAEIEQRAARGASPSLTARITDVANVAASATAAVATRTTTLEAKTNVNHNLIPNPTAKDGMRFWESLGSYPISAGYDLSQGGWFNGRFDNAPSGQSLTLRSLPFQGGYGATWTFSAKGFLSGLNNGYAYLGVYSYTNEAGTTGETNCCNFNFRDLGNPGFFTMPSQTFVAASNAISFRVWLQTVTTGTASSYAHVGAFQMKLEIGSSASAFSDELTERNVFARVTQSEGAIANLNGRNAAWLQQQVEAGSSAAAFVRLYAETSPGVTTSDVSIGAKEIHLYNQVGANFVKALSVVGGNAIFYGGLTAATFIRQGSGEGWPVALANRDFVGGDGATFSWGLTFDNFPSYIAAMNNLAALTAGETYDVRLNVTKTGATVIAKIITPGSPTNYGPISPTFTGGTSAPDYQVGVTSASRGESNDGTYDLSIYSSWNSSFYHSGPGGEVPVYEGNSDAGNVYVNVYAMKSGVWTLVSTEIFSHNVYFGGGYVYPGWNAFPSSAYSETRSVQMGTGVQAIGVEYASYDGGTGPYVGASASMNSAAWQAPGTSSTTRSATAGGQTTRFTVIPK